MYYIVVVTVQQVKTAKRSFVKHQFDPVEDKYVYSLHHCGFQSVSLILAYTAIVESIKMTRNS